MKNSLLFIFVITSFAYMIQSCSAGSDTVIIAGQVIEASSGNAVNDAIVEITSPSNLQQTATTDSAGNFSIDVDPGSETVNVSLEITKQGYETSSTSFKLAPETNVDDLTIELATTGSTGGGNQGGGDDTVGGESGEPASLELTNITSSAIAIRGTGGDEESTFTFVVKDSAGRTVGQGYEVNFSILKGPDGGERINPLIGFTNTNGKVKSSIASGDSAGVVKIEASINNEISSTPVLVAIGNGFPTDGNFRTAPYRRNFEGFGVIASSTLQNSPIPNYIVANVGDYNNNPVLPGTAVDFTTTAGNIDASAITDENGIAIAELRPDGSRPNDHPDGIGFATVTARTADINDNYITSSTKVLFTTQHANISASPTSFSIANGGGESFTFTVTDQNGYPMAAGTEISVEVGSGLTVSGDVGITVPDSFIGGSGITNFAFSIADANPTLSEPANDQVNIVVTTPSGYRSSLSIPGSRAKTK